MPVVLATFAVPASSSNVHAIIPLDLDGYLFKGWPDGRASTVRKRLASDFTGWKPGYAKFGREFERVVEALKMERDPAPRSKLRARSK